MKKFSFSIFFFVLASNGASAQYTTKCGKDFSGGITCETNPSILEQMERSTEQLRRQNEEMQRQQQRAWEPIEKMQQEWRDEQRLADQQREKMARQAQSNWQKSFDANMQLIRSLEAERQYEIRSAPEWQIGGFYSRVEGQNKENSSQCNYRTATGKVVFQGKVYYGFDANVPRSAQCPKKLQISKTTGERKLVAPK